MAGSQNGLYIVAGEMSMVVTAMRRGSRWSSHAHQVISDEDEDSLLHSFSTLKIILNNITDLSDLEPSVFLTPFLDVIRSEDITGPITGLALSSVNKFLAYGIIDFKCEMAAAAVESVADAVTHARFVGTDPASDEVVLMKILHVLRTLLLTPAGTLLSNESVCDIMQSCFRICFEMRLSELLRRSAEHTLMDMVQLLFSRLLQFTEDSMWSGTRKLKMRAGGIDPSRNSRKRRSPRTKHKVTNVAATLEEFPEISLPSPSSVENSLSMGEVPSRNPETFVPDTASIVRTDDNGNFNDAHMLVGLTLSISNTMIQTDATDAPEGLPASCMDATNMHEPLQTTQNISEGGLTSLKESGQSANLESQAQHLPQKPIVASAPAQIETWKRSTEALDMQSEVSSVTEDLETILTADILDADRADNADYVNPRGVRFTAPQIPKEGSGPLVPYGLPCVRELLRFLVSHINPVDRHNTETMIQICLSLLTVALETGVDHIGRFSSLLTLVQDEMCRSLFALLNSERLSVFAASLRVCFLLFEALRTHLKFQLEMFLNRLTDIIVSESPKTPYEQREIALDSVVQLWRIPGLVTELYLNYDCDLYCSNLFEDLTKLLSKNAFPVSGLYSTHLLSLDALLTVIDSIETHCHCRFLHDSQLEVAANFEHLPDSDINKLHPGDGETKSDIPVTLYPSGYMLGRQLVMNKTCFLRGDDNKDADKVEKKAPQIRPNRMRISEHIPSHEALTAIKCKKKLLATGTEQFNAKPSRGIEFLQGHRLLDNPMNPSEVATFLRDNPRLDKRMIGEYVSNRKNLKVLEAFVKSFNFEDTRIDEALRIYLESFRLPGEAPLISLLLEHFAEHWHKSNGEPFANSDAGFTLSYAIIMLNVDQHNYNVKKQNNPMTMEDFKKNLKNVNGGQDFDEEMLEETYLSIKNEEIVMPAEQTGLVRENYLWKVLLRRGSSKDGIFIHAPNGIFDHDLFSLIWGPTVAALSFIFDKSLDSTIIQKAISGFRKCAMISAHYGMSDVFDNLVISLCKFTALLSATEAPDTLPVLFGANTKAQLAAKTVFKLAHRHGDILREGWKNLLDAVLQLYRAKLLPRVMVEVEDFVSTTGMVSLIREDLPVLPRVETGLLSSFYSYITLTADSQAQRGPTPEDEAAKQTAQNCIQECHPEQLITESKFLRLDSLQELVKSLIYACHAPESHTSHSSGYDEDSTVFLLELLVKIVVQNRDRVGSIWPGVRDHLYGLVMSSSASEHYFLLERAVVGILHLAICLLRREEMTSEVLQSLQMLLLLKPPTLLRVSRQIAYAAHELLRTTAANIHGSQDWATLFTLIECAGAGAKPPRILLQNSSGMTLLQDSSSDNGVQSDSELNSSRSVPSPDRGYTSDSELYETGGAGMPRHSTLYHHRPSQESVGSSGGWIFVGKEGEIESVQVKPLSVNQFNIILECNLQPHDPQAFLKSCESLAFLIRDVAHITPANFESCVHCIRTFVEGSMNGGQAFDRKTAKSKEIKKSTRQSSRRKDNGRLKRSKSNPSHVTSDYDADDEDRSDDLLPGYQQASMQLLDLMHTLHTRAASIFKSWANEGDDKSCREASLLEANVKCADQSLWTRCWCPLLQGISRLCCDMRRSVRTLALTYLQRALLVHDLQVLSAAEWEACFNKVLFPLLAKLLENINPQDPSGMEETRMRGAALLSKVFLQHLNPLLSLPTFTALWLTILDFMDKYMHVDRSDLLNEAIPESLKNMLLVMDTAGIFRRPEEGCRPEEYQLWTITWDRIDAFLPGLKEEVFKPTTVPSTGSSLQSVTGIPTSALVTSAMTQEKSVQNDGQSFGMNEDGTIWRPPHTPSTVIQVPSAEMDNLGRDGIQRSPNRVAASPLTCSSPLTTSTANLPLTSSVILHPPVAPLSYVQGCLAAQPHTTSTGTLPLLINPTVISQSSVNFISPQVPPTSTDIR